MVINKDIEDISPSTLKLKGAPTVIIAGPPCQAFSTSNQKTRTDDNPLNDLLFEPIRFIKSFLPRLVVIENVEGLSIGSRKNYLIALQERLQRYGYFCQIVKVTGEQVGIPQNRTRLFVIGTRKRLSEIEMVRALLPVCSPQRH
jgi:DNA (cytosine-5)-methyltransferase 1